MDATVHLEQRHGERTAGRAEITSIQPLYSRAVSANLLHAELKTESQQKSLNKHSKKLLAICPPNFQLHF
jgi:hypothetical protein